MLFNKIISGDIHARMGGRAVFKGGGGGASQTTSIDPDIKKRVLPALDDVSALYRSGALGATADTSGVQRALGAQDALSDAVYREGLGTENLLRQLDNTRGQQIAGGLGTLGSARADRAREAALADQALTLQQADLTARAQAAKGITDTAAMRRALEQERLDAPHKASERYFGYLQAAPQGSQTTSSQSGGK